ncbi:MAG: class I SAM-dependent rRNA methyltransferase [Planctomycetes bacterium]|nr:class I SAM-dependent rRNA methyltransferase [Planctomycetota bacterium]
MPSRPVVRLRVPGTRGHLFFFRKMVEYPDRSVEPGTLVDVVDRTGADAGTGFYNPDSEITIRLISTRREESDAFIDDRLKAAVAMRHDLLKLPEVTEAYRVCHAEGDGLTGLIVDRLGPVIVAQLWSRGWFVRREALRTSLKALFPNTQIRLVADERACENEGFEPPDEAPPDPVLVAEHGVQFRVNFATGHKTGFFCDQRENRRVVAGLSAGRSVLDLCCYTGGFAVSAAKAGAKKVVGVDLDEDALETAKKNGKVNKVAVEWKHGDVFDIMRKMPQPSEFDVVVLDPAKLARNQLELAKARRAYYDLNRLAFSVVARGGVLVTCSCSGLVGEPEFLEIVREAARTSNREYRVFRIAGAAPDHPVSTLYPEGRYLKAVFGVVV